MRRVGASQAIWSNTSSETAGPNFSGATSADTFAFLRHWFSHYNDREKVIYIAAMPQTGYKITYENEAGNLIEEYPGGQASDWLGNDHMAAMFPTGTPAHTLVHEVGHLFGRQHFAALWASEPDHRKLPTTNTANLDAMSYKSTGLEFSVDNLMQIRQFTSLDH